MLLHTLDDQALLAGMRRIAGNIRTEQVRGLQHLAEIDARKAFVPEGYPSLWAYCREELKFSESVASRWMRAMKVTRRYPDVLVQLGAGRLTLCAVSMLADHLTDDNWREVVARAEGRTKIQVQEIVADLAPKPAKKDVVRAVAGLAFDAANAATPSPAVISNEAAPPANFSGRSCPEVASIPVLAARPTIKPQAPNVWRISFDASAATKEKLDRLKELRAGKLVDDLVGEALDLLLDKIDPLRRNARREMRKDRASKDVVAAVCVEGATVSVELASAPIEAKEESPSGRRPIPVAIRDAVYARDGGCCSYVSMSGRRCEGRAFIALDHIHPVALGGGNSPENLRNLCRLHHKLVTREVFGTQCS